MFFEKIENKNIYNEISNLDLEQLSNELINLLINKNISISTAESLTGGRVSDSITNVSGASNIFKEGFIVYSNEAKENNIQVNASIIEKYGAVSKECCVEMCEKTLHKTGSCISIATTGVAGPSKSEGKEVGLVYIGICYKNNTYVKELHLNGNRIENKTNTTKFALYYTRKVILENNNDN